MRPPARRRDPAQLLHVDVTAHRPFVSIRRIRARSAVERAELVQALARSTRCTVDVHATIRQSSGPSFFDRVLLDPSLIRRGV